MDIRDHYLEGTYAGMERADADLRAQRGTGGYELELREEAATAVATAHTDAGRKNAAFMLGYVRAYREAVR